MAVIRLIAALVFLCLPLGARAQMPSVTIYDPGQFEAEFSGWPEYVRIRLPLDYMQQAFRDGLTKAGQDGKDVTFTVMDAALTDYSHGSPILVLRFDLDGKIHSVGENFRCRGVVKFGLPPAAIVELKTQLQSIQVNCSTSGLLADGLGVDKILQSAITIGMSYALNQALLKDGSLQDYLDFVAEDPTLDVINNKSKVQLSYCDGQRWKQSLCLTLAIKPPNLWSLYSKYRDGVPGKGPVALTRAELLAKAQAFIDVAPLAPRMNLAGDPVPGEAFPCKHKETGEWDCDDSTIFNGLLCMADIKIGCRTVANAQGPDGRFWRSPNSIDEPRVNPFTGDQYKGFLMKQTASPDEAAFIQFQRFIAAHKVPLPDKDHAIDHGYKFCLNDSDNTCVVGTGAWVITRHLANTPTMLASLPPDMHDPASKFGMTPDYVIWDVLFAPAGFRLHLAAIELFIAQRGGWATAKDAEAAAIVAARQPTNPFFLYLHLGADQRVLDAADAKCEINPVQPGYTEWQWERAANDPHDPKPKSMRWDCAFIYSLLAQSAPARATARKEKGSATSKTK